MAEVICLSSDDDFQVKKPKKKSTDLKKPEKHKDDKFKKRKASTELNTSTPKKRIQLTKVVKRQPSDDGVEVVEVVPQVPKEDISDEKTLSKSASMNWSFPSTSRAGSSSERKNNGPKLMIKEKRPVDRNDIGSEVFAQFLSLCLTKDRSPDMKKIVEKLKRRYEQTDPAYVQCPAFISLLNEKRDSLMKEGSVYTHICEIHSEMKCRKKGAVLPKEEEVAEESAVEEVRAESSPVDRRVKLLSKAMTKCEKRIKELREAEVDWDDDDNSNYMKLSKYEEKMTRMYAKMCELTGDDYDAGRRYLKPKNLKVTGIPDVDQAIISFMSKKLKDKRKRTQQGLSTANCVIFPDYCDIINCIKECNEQQKLRMKEEKIEEVAKKAFADLGNHLQKVRKDDLIDSFSLVLENTSDPARENPELLRKLEESKAAGRKKMDEIFEEFARRQDEGSRREDGNETKSDAEGDKDEEQDDEEDDCNDVDSASRAESDMSNSVEDCSTDPLEVTGNPLNGDGMTHDDSEEVSDSADTVLISPSRVAHRVHQIDQTPSNRMVKPHYVVADVEGTVTIPTEKLEAEGWRTENLSKIISKPGPKSSKVPNPGKPSIKNIQNVKVVIKAHEIVRISEFQDQTASGGEQSSVSENDLKSAKSVVESIKLFPDNGENGKESPDNEETAFGGGSKEKIERKVPSAVNSYIGNTIISKELELKNGGVPSQPNSKVSKTASITESTSTLQDSPPKQIAIEDNPPTKAASVENPEITSSTENIIAESKSPQLTVLEDVADQVDDTAVTENDSPLPDSTLQGADIKEADNTKDINKSEIETRPVLKLRAFAKPPEFWNNSPEKKLPTPKIKKTANPPKTIECVDLEDNTVGTNSSSSSAGASSLPRARVPGSVNMRSAVNRTVKDQSTVVRIIEHAKPSKTRVIDASRAKILPLDPARSSSIKKNNSLLIMKQSPARPIQNTTVGSSSVQQDPRYVRMNTAIHTMLTSPSCHKLVNPVSMLKIMKKRQ
ncbi:death domain-associated protein 6 [Diachasma alloeum]|uniref:death domain-associated protein 6 n=1 Tax=Diachasma alloeum TaxID=454923 RepID=UPI000738182B|nr:death domain-associated protein 6 [Diachasma alloeum]